MTEERGIYNLHHDDPHGGVDGVERIGDVLHQLIDQRGWPQPPGTTPANGNRPRANDDPRHRDA